MGKERVYIVGCGPGHRGLITLRAMEVIEQATVCVGAERLLKEFVKGCSPAGRRLMVLGGNYSAVLDEVEALWHGGERVVFLVSGDPMLYSLGTLVVERFGRDNCEVVPGISSVQYAFSLLKEGWQGYRVVSLHGRRDGNVAEYIKKGEKLVIMLDGSDSLRFLAGELGGVDCSGYSFYLASQLSLPTEQVRPISVDEFVNTTVPSLSILIARRG